MSSITRLDATDASRYDALHGAVLFDDDSVWRSFRGAKAADVLNGLVTNDVATLPVGAVQRAVALTPKGKVVADLLIVHAEPELFLVGASGASAAGWADLVRKYVNPRLCAVIDESARLRSWWLVGAAAESVAGRIAEERNAAHHAPDAMRASVEAPHASTLHAAPLVTAGGLPRVLLLADRAREAALHESLEREAVPTGSEALHELVRIESGLPRWGSDMDENTIPQEANLDTLGAISFTKGCYTGQETVARVHFRGHVNRHLRGLVAAVPLEPGASLADATGKIVGDVRSSAVSPRRGPVALAMVRREVALGTALSVSQPDGSIVEAQVLPLPFPG